MLNDNKALFQATIGDLKEMIEELFSPGGDFPEEPQRDVKKHLV